LDKIQEGRNKKAAINTSRTRAEKAKAQAEYTEVNKQVKRSIRTDKRKYVGDLATTAEKAAKEGNMRQLYDTTKKLSGNHRKPERPVKSKEGKVITNIEEQRDRWVEHFKELLNIIRNSYDGLNCKIVHGGQLTDSFEIKTGVR
uniref:Transposase n=1 Tax=Schistosoma curassoni TaxID=6186 RepID=A0A183KUA0_9TREM